MESEGTPLNCVASNSDASFQSELQLVVRCYSDGEVVMSDQKENENGSKCFSLFSRIVLREGGEEPVQCCTFMSDYVLNNHIILLLASGKSLIMYSLGEQMIHSKQIHDPMQYEFDDTVMSVSASSGICVVGLFNGDAILTLMKDGKLVKIATPIGGQQDCQIKSVVVRVSVQLLSIDTSSGNIHFIVAVLRANSTLHAHSISYSSISNQLSCYYTRAFNVMKDAIDVRLTHFSQRSIIVSGRGYVQLIHDNSEVSNPFMYYTTRTISMVADVERRLLFLCPYAKYDSSKNCIFLFCMDHFGTLYTTKIFCDDEKPEYHLRIGGKKFDAFPVGYIFCKENSTVKFFDHLNSVYSLFVA
jgi:hypothetical protein